jgi:hypothetical protein
LAPDLAAGYVQLADLLRQTARPETACERYAQAIQTLEALPRDKSRPAAVTGILRNARRGRAEALRQLAPYSESLAEWDRALQLAEGPDQNLFRAARLRTRVHLEEPASVTAEARVLAEKADVPPPALFELAGVYAVAGTAATPEPAAEPYPARAMALLSRARAAGLFQDLAYRTRLRDDPDLAPLRARPDFTALVKHVEEEGNPGSPARTPAVDPPR